MTFFSSVPMLWIDSSSHHSACSCLRHRFLPEFEIRQVPLVKMVPHRFANRGVVPFALSETLRRAIVSQRALTSNLHGSIARAYVAMQHRCARERRSNSVLRHDWRGLARGGRLEQALDPGHEVAGREGLGDVEVGAHREPFA